MEEVRISFAKCPAPRGVRTVRFVWSLFGLRIEDGSDAKSLEHEGFMYDTRAG